MIMIPICLNYFGYEEDLPNNDEDDLSNNEHNPQSRHPFIIKALSFLRLTHPAYQDHDNLSLSYSEMPVLILETEFFTTDQSIESDELYDDEVYDEVYEV